MFEAAREDRGWSQISNAQGFAKMRVCQHLEYWGWARLVRRAFAGIYRHLSAPDTSKHFTLNMSECLPKPASLNLQPANRCLFASACQVSPRRIRRSPSWSALNDVVLGHTSAKDDQAFVFMLKVRGRIRLCS